MEADESTAVAEIPVAEPVDSPADIPASIAPTDADALIALKNLEEKRKKKRRSRNIKIGVVGGLAAAVIAFFALGGPDMFAPQDEEGPTAPETAMVEREDFSESISAQGSIKPATSVVVTPEVDGTIDQVMVSEGQHVEEGDILFTMRSPELDKAVAEAGDAVDAAAAEVSSAQKTVGSLQSAYKKAKKEYKAEKAKAEKQAAKARAAGEKARVKAYNKAIKAIPKDATKSEVKELTAAAEKAGQDAYDTAYAAVPVAEVEPFDDASYVEQIASAKEAVTTAQGSLSSAQSTYQQACEDQAKCTVRAPQAGTLLSFSAVPGMGIGEAAGVGESSGSLAQIADLSRLKVNVQINEIDISSIEENQRAIVTFSAFPDLELQARVADIASVADGSGDGDYDGGGGIVTFKVGLVIDKPDARLKPGMTASVDILTQDIPNALVIPVGALSEGDDGKLQVEVVTDEETFATETRTVKVGAQSSLQAVIKKGLKEGEVVMLYGGFADDDDEGDEDEDEGGMMEDFEEFEG